MPRLVAALAALALLAGCEAVQKLENHKVMAAVVIRSPDLDSAGQGLPALHVTGVAAAQVFFGERQDSVSQPPTGLSGAAVTLAWAGTSSGSVVLQPVSQGWYQVTGGFDYAPGTTYTFTVVYLGDTFTGTVSAPPQAPRIKELAGAIVPQVFPPFPVPTFYLGFDHQTVSRDGDDVAFYSATDVAGAAAGAVTCSNQPFGDAGAMIQLLLDPSPWKVPAFTLFRSDRTSAAAQRCFPQESSYLVTLTTVKTGSVSSNLFLGSGVLAGASDAGLLILQ